MLCDHCKHADAVGGYPDGQDMFVCAKENDPRIPFTVDEKTAYCPCYEPDPKIKTYEKKPAPKMADPEPAEYPDMVLNNPGGWF